jgi:hypothetical protein
MNPWFRFGIITLAVVLALMVGILIGDRRPFSQIWRDTVSSMTGASTVAHDPALQAGLPVPDPSAGLPPCPLNELLKPELTPQQQTDIIGQMLIDYWTTTRSLPNGTWDEIRTQLAGRNKEKLALVPSGHPAMQTDSFRPAKDAPGIRLHVVSSSGAAFQLIHDGPDGKPYTDDDLIRSFPPDLEVP